MIKKSFWAINVVGLVACIVFSGCSGGGGGTQSPVPETKTGIFMDSPVSGIRYSTSSGKTGTTNSSGEFQYLEGDTVDFYIGYCPIATIPAAKILTVFDTQSPEKIAMMLQAIDEDDNPDNGINISEALSEKFHASLFTVDEVNPDNVDFKTKFKNITGKDFLVSEDRAMDHAEAQIRDKAAENLDFYKYYKGTDADIYNVNNELGYNAELLQASSSKRVNLYFYRYMIDPRLEIEALKYKQNMNISVDKHEAFSNNIKKSSDYVSVLTIVSSSNGLVSKAMIDVTKKEVEDGLFDIAHHCFIGEIDSWSDPFKEAIFREIKLLWGCKGLLTGAKKPQDKVDCFNTLASATFEGVNDAFTAWELAGESEALNTNTVIRSYLRQFYQQGTNISSLYSKYSVSSEDDLILAIANESLTDGAEFDPAKAKTKIDEYKLTILTTTNRMLQDYQLAANLPASAELSDIDAKIADGMSHIAPHPTQDGMYVLSTKIELNNSSYLYSNVDIGFEVILDGDDAYPLDPMSLELSPRANHTESVDLVLPYDIQDRLLSDPFVFRMTMEYKGQTISDTQIIDVSSSIYDLLFEVTPPSIIVHALLDNGNIILDAGMSSVHQSQGPLSYSWSQVIKANEPEVQILVANEYSQTKEQVYFQALDIQETTDLWFKVQAIASVSQATSESVIKVTLYTTQDTLNSKPIAQAGENIIVQSGSPFTLNGAGSSDPNGDVLSYRWYYQNTVVGTSQSVTLNLTTAGQYTYALTVTDPSGATDTDWVTVTVESIAEVTPTSPVVSVTPGNTKNIITWNSVDGATSYDLYWLNSADVTTGSGNQISNVTSPYTHTGLTNGTVYYYIVTATNDNGESPASMEVSATPVEACTVFPAPVLLSPANGSTVSTESQTLTWQAVVCGEAIPHYRVMIAENAEDLPSGNVDECSGCAYFDVTADNVTSLSVNLFDDKAYYWQVRAEAEGISGNWSEQKTFSINVSSVPHPVPDTGQTTCYDDAGNVLDPCPSEGEDFYGQDASYTINPPSYTKLDSNGNDLPLSATSWAMVRDNVTGLIWEVKTNDGGIHDKDNTYTWYDSDPLTNGSNAGTDGDGTDTEDFISSLNQESFGGFSDWRVPTLKELLTIVDYGEFDPSVDRTYFPNTISVSWPDYSSTPIYWSSTTYVNSPGSAWRICFSYGYVTYIFGGKYKLNYVRAVRGKK